MWVGRSVKALSAGTGVFDDLVNIGIDENSYKKGHKYLTLVVNHDTNTVVWVGIGIGKTVLEGFFGLLNDKQKANIKAVSRDGAGWIKDTVEANCPNAIFCIDPFHVVSWVTNILDRVLLLLLLVCQTPGSKQLIIRLSFLFIWLTDLEILII